MENQLIQLFTTNASLETQFVQALENIKTYSSWITSQSNTTDAALNATLTKAKTGDASWYNKIFPQYLNMPATILSKGQKIDSDLTLLISLSDQLQTQDSAVIRSSISSYAKSLNTTLGDIEKDISSLASGLLQYNTALSSDIVDLTTATSQIAATIQSLRQKISVEQGQLHSLQKANCPSKSKISEMEKLIASTIKSLNQYSAYYTSFNKSNSLAHSATTAAAFLTNYWTGFSTNINTSMTQLQNVESTPAAILKLDLIANQKNWDSIKKEYSEINSSIN